VCYETIQTGKPGETRLRRVEILKKKGYQVDL